MLNSRFLRKIFIGYVAVILASTAISGLLFSSRVRVDTLRRIEESLHAKVVLLNDIAALPLTGADDPLFQKRIQILGRSLETRLTVVRSDGLVIADSENDPATMENHGRRPEILDARDRGLGTATRFSSTANRNTMYHAIPVKRAGKLLGYVRASIITSAVDAELVRLRTTIFTMAGLAALVGLLMGLLLSYRVVKPLNVISREALLIAKGEGQGRVPHGGNDEVGDLARSFNRMSASIETRISDSAKEKNKLLAILMGMAEGVVAVDEEERILHMNDAAGRILRVTLKDNDVHDKSSDGKRIWEVVRLQAVNKIIRRAMLDGQKLKEEIRIARDGKDQIVEMHATPLETGGAVLVLHDLTDLRQLEAIRSDFVANVSHELKTPITAIRGLVETVLDHEEMEPEARNGFLNKVKNQSHRLTSLVGDLLTISRLESGHDESYREPVDLCTLLDESVDEFRPAAISKNIELVIVRREKPVEVFANRDELRQLIDNLLGNAIQYTPEEGKVKVSVFHQEGDAFVEVEDTGIGINPAHRTRIFERFYRVDKARSRDLGGTGLGLAIVKHIALSHGGSVSVESAPGRGSRFLFRMPPRGEN